MNITYLLGAGASYNALPIVGNIPDALSDFANLFNPGERYHTIAPIELWSDNIDGKNTNLAKYALYQYKDDLKKQKERYNELKEFHNDILWLTSNAKIHTSVDTFAKKLYLQKNDKNLKKLKTILSCFFLFLQTKEFDYRYDSFFASILDDLTNLPENLKILSWNYDSQLEIGFSNFTNETIHQTKKQLKLHSRGDVMFDAYSPTEFCVYKINGTTTIKKGEFDVAQILSDFNTEKLNLVEIFLNIHKELKNQKNTPSMTFAWEGFNIDKGFFPNLRNSITETEILIVIGYSFPFFNRKTDKFILDSMSNLKKIYVQDPYNAEDIIEKIKGLIPDKKTTRGNYLEPIEYEPKTFTDQFFIPIEF